MPAFSIRTATACRGPVTGDLGLTIAGKLTPATVAQEINALYVTLYGIAAADAGIKFWENVLHGFDGSITTSDSASTAMEIYSLAR